MGNIQSQNIVDTEKEFEQYDPWWNPTPHEDNNVTNNEAYHTTTTTVSSDIDKNSEQLDATSSATCSYTDIMNLLNKEDNVGTQTTTNVDGYSRSLDSRKKLEIFKEHLEKKRLQRQQIIGEKKRELQQLRIQLEKERQENQILKAKLFEYDKNNGHSELMTTHGNEREHLMKIDEILKENVLMKNEIKTLQNELKQMEHLIVENKELQNEQVKLQNELQALHKQVVEYENHKEEYHKHIMALKDIIKISKQMIVLREEELQEVKQKLAEIEKVLTDREMSSMSNDLRNEYERQLRNIRNLRTLYDERARICRIELQNMRDQLTDAQDKLQLETNKNEELVQRVTELEEDNSNKFDNIVSLESDLGLTRAECRELQYEMNVINELFARFLLGFNNLSENINLDKLTSLLEENHDLFTDISGKDASGRSPALPRILLDLFNQINNENPQNKDGEPNETADVDVKETTVNESTVMENVDTGQQGPGLIDKISSAKEIMMNLPKVWKVLAELLSHQAAQPVEINQDSGTVNDENNPCYKSVNTPAGTQYVPSVSKTYIRLKNLILEKKYLEKEMDKMKKLNTHLEERLQEQETRLVLVTKELSKTWHIVGRLQRQHEQLHTHEKILRYELSQKRKLLNELKEELEYCKEKWEKAREKNNESEHECHRLRSEFASRRAMALINDCNASPESGYSDEQEEIEDSEEDEIINDDLLEDLTLEKDKLLFHIQNELKIPIVVDQSSDENSEIEDATATSLVQNVEDVEGVEDCLESTSVERLSTDNPEECRTNNEQDSTNSMSSPNDAVEPTLPQLDETNTNNLESVRTVKINDQIKKTEDIIEARNQRFQRLEQQCNDLKQKYTRQTAIGNELCTKMDQIHQIHGDETVPKASETKEYLNETPSCSSDMGTTEAVIATTATPPVKKTTKDLLRETEEFAKRREERFKRLEDQFKELKQTYTNQTERGTELCSRLDNIHDLFTTKDKARLSPISEELKEHVPPNVELGENSNSSSTDVASCSKDLPSTESDISGNNDDSISKTPENL